MCGVASVVKTIVVLFWYVCGDTCDSGGRGSATGLQPSSTVNRLWAGSGAGVMGVAGIKGWPEERFKSGLGEGRVSPPQ